MQPVNEVCAPEERGKAAAGVREVVTVTDERDKRLGEKTTLYCEVCEEEQTFVWTQWGGMEYFGYSPEREYGWECTVCGSKVPAP